MLLEPKRVFEVLNDVFKNKFHVIPAGAIQDLYNPNRFESKTVQPYVSWENLCDVTRSMKQESVYPAWILVECVSGVAKVMIDDLADGGFSLRSGSDLCRKIGKLQAEFPTVKLHVGEIKGDGTVWVATCKNVFLMKELEEKLWLQGERPITVQAATENDQAQIIYWMGTPDLNITGAQVKISVDFQDPPVPTEGTMGAEMLVRPRRVFQLMEMIYRKHYDDLPFGAIVSAEPGGILFPELQHRRWAKIWQECNGFNGGDDEMYPLAIMSFFDYSTNETRYEFLRSRYGSTFDSDLDIDNERGKLRSLINSMNVQHTNPQLFFGSIYPDVEIDVKPMQDMKDLAQAVKRASEDDGMRPITVQWANSTDGPNTQIIYWMGHPQLVHDYIPSEFDENMPKEEAASDTMSCGNTSERKDHTDMFMYPTIVYRTLANIYQGSMSDLPDAPGIRQGWPCDRGDIFIGAFDAIEVQVGNANEIVDKACYNTGYANIPWNGMQAFVSTATKDCFKMNDALYPFAFTMDVEHHALEICGIPTNELTRGMFVPTLNTLVNKLLIKTIGDKSVNPNRLFVGYVDGYKRRFVECYSVTQIIVELESCDRNYRYIPLCVQFGQHPNKADNTAIFWMYNRELELNGNYAYDERRNAEFDGTIEASSK